MNNGSGNGAPSVTAPVEVPIENAAPNVQEEDEGVEGEGAPLMSTQDYMAEAEELLANPMDTQEEAAPQVQHFCSQNILLKCCSLSQNSQPNKQFRRLELLAGYSCRTPCMHDGLQDI